jgi:hypothetical protein
MKHQEYAFPYSALPMNDHEESYPRNPPVVSRFDYLLFWPTQIGVCKKYLVLSGLWEGGSYSGESFGSWCLFSWDLDSHEVKRITMEDCSELKVRIRTTRCIKKSELGDFFMFFRPESFVFKDDSIRTN